MTFILALTFLVGMVWDAIESPYAVSLAAATQAELDSGIVVLSLTAVSDRTETPFQASPHPEVGGRADLSETCDITTVAALSPLEMPMTEREPEPFPTALQIRNDIFEVIRNTPTTGAGGADLISFARNKVLPNFAPAYRSVLKLAAFMGLPRIQSEAALKLRQASFMIPPHGQRLSKSICVDNLAACATASSTSRRSHLLKVAQNKSSSGSMMSVGLSLVGCSI